MKDDNYTYIIYRIYDSSFNNSFNIRNASVLFGWSFSKKIIKAFMLQRDSNKYRVIKESTCDNSFLTSRNMIDSIQLKSVKSGEDVIFFTTANEVEEGEKKIQRLFSEKCSFDDIYKNDNNKYMKYLNIFMNITEYYADALYDLGFRPSDLDVLYFHNNDTEGISGIVELIEYSYDKISSKEKLVINGQLPGQRNIYDTFNKIIYSIESFIKVLKDDL